MTTVKCLRQFSLRFTGKLKFVSEFCPELVSVFVVIFFGGGLKLGKGL